MAGGTKATDILEKARKQIEEAYRKATLFPDGAADPIPEFVRTIPEFLAPIDATVDQIASEIILRIQTEFQTKLPRYSPRLYGIMLNESAALLNRCQHYKREAELTAAAAIREVFDRIARQSKRHAQRYLLSRNAAVLNTARATGYEEAAAAFGDGDSNAKGNARVVVSDANYIKGMNLIEGESRNVTEFLLDIESSYDSTVKEMSERPGSPLNLVDRYSMLIDFFEADLAELYERLRAAELGLSTSRVGTRMWVESNPLPRSSPSVFDDLVLWVREAMKEVDALELRDQEVTVALVIGDDDDKYTRFSVMKREEAAPLLAKDGSGVFGFWLRPNHLPEQMQNYRVQSFGLCWLPSRELKEDLAAQNMRFTASVRPPKQAYPSLTSDLGAVSLFESMPDFHVGAVGISSIEGNYLDITGPGLWNANPFGPWRVALDPVGITTTSSVNRGTDNMRGLVLYLNLIGRFK